MVSSRISVAGRFLPLLFIALLAAPALRGHELVDFEGEVKPILQQSCGGLGCHINERKNGVELTSYETLMASVGDQYKRKVVIPGDAAASPLIDKISKEIPAFGERMPRGVEPLTDSQVSTISRWIEEGAREGHHLFRGDVDGNDSVDISDAILVLFNLFGGGESPRCPVLLDSDSSGSVDLTDAIFILQYLYLSGPTPEELTEDEEKACDQAAELSYTSIYQKVFAASCAFASCHSTASHKGGLVLDTREGAHLALIGIAPTNESALASGFLRVDPGKPDTSFLLKKISAPGPGEGNRMPANSSIGLSQSAISAIREWILAGAPLEGTIHGVPDIQDEEQPPIDRLPAPPVPANGMQLHLEPFAIGPDSEREIFYFMKTPLGALPSDPVVTQFDVHMTEDSHHFILYQWTGSSDPPAGVRDIGGAFDIINGRRLILGSQQSFFSLTFPPGVGLKLSRSASFDLNSHYLNLHRSQTLYGEVYLNMFFAPPGTITTFAQPIFDVNVNIYVPPNATRTTKRIFPMSSSGRVPSGKEYHLYSLGSHMHRHGVDFSVYLTNNLQDVVPKQLVYKNVDWDDPKFQQFDPPFVLKAGQGLRFEVTHHYDDPPSPSAAPLTFGLTSEDEMAILLGYYSVK